MLQSSAAPLRTDQEELALALADHFRRVPPHLAVSAHEALLALLRFYAPPQARPLPRPHPAKAVLLSFHYTVKAS